MISFTILRIRGATNHRMLFPEPAAKRVAHEIAEVTDERNIPFP